MVQPLYTSTSTVRVVFALESRPLKRGENDSTHPNWVVLVVTLLPELGGWPLLPQTFTSVNIRDMRIPGAEFHRCLHCSVVFLVWEGIAGESGCSKAD